MSLNQPTNSSPDFRCCPASINESIFRHSGWAARRLQTFEALKRVATRPQALEAFAECGSALYLNVSEGKDDLKLTCNCCRSRWCLPCATARARIIATNVRTLIGDLADRWVTLTLRHSDTPLSDQLDRLFESFKRLRKCVFWQDRVQGGAAFTELKISEKDGRWHVHLHILLQSTYLDQQELTARWHAITGDSFIVDVRKIHDNESLTRYLCKYITKPADSSVYAQPNRLDEMILALKGRHLCYTFGTWRGHKLSTPPDSGIVWKSVGAIDSLLDHAADGDAHALRWLEAAARKWPSLANLRSRSPPRTLPPDVSPF